MLKLLSIAAALFAVVSADAVQLRSTPRILLVAPSGWKLVVFEHGSALLEREDNPAVSQAMKEGAFDFAELRREVERLIQADPCGTETRSSDGTITFVVGGPRC